MSKALTAHREMFRQTTAHSSSPLVSPAPVSSLSSVIRPALPEDSQEAGNGRRANNREEGKGREGRKDRTRDRGIGKKEAVCNNRAGERS